MKKIKIATGAGTSGDRIEPAIEVAEKGEIDYIIFECLAERTIAIAQQKKLLCPKKGYDELFEARMKSVLPICFKKNIKILTNMGAANPESAGEKIVEIAETLGLGKMKLAIILGDDVSNIIWNNHIARKNMAKNSKINKIKESAISANAYTGVESLLKALRKGADIIITGRTADTSLFLAPMMYELGWRENDWNLIGSGIIISHLMECGGQITGGYFADPGKKNVSNISRLGFPIAEIYKNGEAIITKIPEAGGKVTLLTCKEQLLYEIHDPSAYITPDGIADFTSVQLQEVEKNKIKIIGGKGKPNTETLKVNIGYMDGYLGEGQISYAGPGAYERAKLASKIVLERFNILNLNLNEIRVDYIGINSLHGPIAKINFPYPNEVRLRVVGKTKNKEEAIMIGDEVESLYTNGPAGGGGVTKMVKEILAITSTLIPRNCVKMRVQMRDIGI